MTEFVTRHNDILRIATVIDDPIPHYSFRARTTRAPSCRLLDRHQAPVASLSAARAEGPPASTV
jgi:hypothetical protein